jgi:hypothetical protein
MSHGATQVDPLPGDVAPDGGDADGAGLAGDNCTPVGGEGVAAVSVLGGIDTTDVDARVDVCATLATHTSATNPAMRSALTRRRVR